MLMYIHDFSKALASEVRILLAEVGKLRDERRQLQYEIAELMSVKSKHGAGGEYMPDWAPKPDQAPDPPSPGPPPPQGVADDAGLFALHGALVKAAKANPPALLPPPPVPEPMPNLPAWAQWRPNPMLSPTPHAPTAGAPMPSDRAPTRAGLFGPPTPPPK
ncbi:hypothetical protein A0H81_03103 [Grifola frondosa]|uniref:Uncharacterized protein n=1 Tax=Grifola frondosa TaxID=5627 RepID=A0A1C7MIJ8_GRIFR|nr:hypothetical protein A0H81_03103 [Grifola frondosa]